jgi:hypothetical protein
MWKTPVESLAICGKKLDGGHFLCHFSRVVHWLRKELAIVERVDEFPVRDAHHVTPDWQRGRRTRTDRVWRLLFGEEG